MSTRKTQNLPKLAQIAVLGHDALVKVCTKRAKRVFFLIRFRSIPGFPLQ